MSTVAWNCFRKAAKFSSYTNRVLHMILGVCNRSILWPSIYCVEYYKENNMYIVFIFCHLVHRPSYQATWSQNKSYSRSSGWHNRWTLPGWSIWCNCWWSPWGWSGGLQKDLISNDYCMHTPKLLHDIVCMHTDCYTLY